MDTYNPRVPWRGHNGKWCKICGGHVDQVGPLSARYRCEDCGRSRLEQNYDQLLAHNGPWWTHWRLRCLAALGVVVDTDD